MGERTNYFRKFQRENYKRIDIRLDDLEKLKVICDHNKLSRIEQLSILIDREYERIAKEMTDFG